MDLNGNLLYTMVYDNPGVIRGERLISYKAGFAIAGHTFDSLSYSQVNLMFVDIDGNFYF